MLWYADDVMPTGIVGDFDSATHTTEDARTKREAVPAERIARKVPVELQLLDYLAHGASHGQML